MPIFFENQRYNMDWVPVDDMGNAIGPKDWAANRRYDEQNDPSGAWNFSPEVKAANPVAWDQTARGREQANLVAPTPYDWNASRAAMDAALARNRQPAHAAPGVPTVPSTPQSSSSKPTPTGQQTSGGPTDDFSNQITTAYQHYLQRAPGPDDVQKWWSGGYGYGSGMAGLPAMIEAIRNSDEARLNAPIEIAGMNDRAGIQKQTSSEGTSTGATFDPTEKAVFSAAIAQAYQEALGRAPSGDEINKWWTGQYGYGTGLAGLPSMLAAIKNSPEARSRPGNKKWGDPGGDYAGWFLNSVVKGLAPTPQSLESLRADLEAYGIKLGEKNAQGFIDKIILPDGSVWDVIESATATGGKRWQFIPDSPGGASGGPGGSGPAGQVGGGPLPPNQYNDPNTALLESLIKARIGELQGGYDDFYRKQYEAGLQDRANSLATGNAQLDQLMDYLQKRFIDLQGSGYTGAEQEVLRTATLDPIERDRTAAKKRLTERLAAMGHGPGSGVFQDAMLQLDNEFDGIRAIQQTQLATNELARREDRNQRAELIGAQIADIPDLRSREQLDVFQALDNLSAIVRGEDEARSREAIAYGGVLSDLGPQRLQLALQAAGMGGNPAQLGGLLTSIMGLNQNQSQINQSNNNALWSGLGTMAAIIARSRQSGVSNQGM